MENKSRVVKYESLRKKIANMDVYSFDETDEVAKNLPKSSSRKTSEEVNEDPPIKKNTLSLSIDQLIEANEAYDQEVKKKETESLYQEKKKERLSHQRRFTQGKIILLITIPFALLVLIFILTLLFTGAI